MDDAVATWTATRLAAALRAGEITSRDLLELYLDRIERLNPPVNAVITLDAEPLGPMPTAPTTRRTGASGAGRCTGSRSPSRTRSRFAASRPRVAHGS